MGGPGVRGDHHLSTIEDRCQVLKVKLTGQVQRSAI
jgi:hypothetical protein